ncbi:TPA: hypothetical protein ACIVDT_004564 [Salmonella enterica subsp. enterica serovar Eastbourne]
MAGDEVLPREWLRADSGSDPLSARMDTALAHFLSSGVRVQRGSGVLQLQYVRPWETLLVTTTDIRLVVE